MKVSKGTIIRIVLALLVLLNWALKAFGKSPFDYDEGSVEAAVELAIELAVLGVAIWKNNSCTEAAIRADEFLKQLREEAGAFGTYSYDDFVNHYIGKSTDWDGVYGVQCVDLIKAYLYEVFAIKADRWGNAKYYWINYALHPALVKNFDKIKNTPNFVPQRGDIVIWNGNIGSNDTGHIAIATGEGDKSYFVSYDQNFGKKYMRKVEHSYNCVYGVLRPKDQSRVKSIYYTGTNKGSYPKPVQWNNGKTKEKLFSSNKYRGYLLEIGAKAKYWCYSKAGGAWLIVATWDGGKHATAGFVKYSGGLKGAPGESKTWVNDATYETVYADVEKKKRIGTINPHESAYCLAEMNGMYLVLYKVDESNEQKCGFVSYSGGC